VRIRLAVLCLRAASATPAPVYDFASRPSLSANCT
jgi:hypothetical protein